MTSPRTMTRTRGLRRAFTLIELLVVIAIMNIERGSLFPYARSPPTSRT